jgi:hypothetical protein
MIAERIVEFVQQPSLGMAGLNVMLSATRSPVAMPGRSRTETDFAPSP